MTVEKIKLPTFIAVHCKHISSEFSQLLRIKCSSMHSLAQGRCSSLPCLVGCWKSVINKLDPHSYLISCFGTCYGWLMANVRTVANLDNWASFECCTQGWHQWLFIKSSCDCKSDVGCAVGVICHSSVKVAVFVQTKRQFVQCAQDPRTLLHISFRFWWMMKARLVIICRFRVPIQYQNVSTDGSTCYFEMKEKPRAFGFVRCKTTAFVLFCTGISSCFTNGALLWLWSYLRDNRNINKDQTLDSVRICLSAKNTKLYLEHCVNPQAISTQNTCNTRLRS